MCTTRARTTCNLPCRYVHVLGTPRARGRARDVPARTCRAHVAQDRERGFQKQLTCTTCARHVHGQLVTCRAGACMCWARHVHVTCQRARVVHMSCTIVQGVFRNNLRARHVHGKVHDTCTRKNEKKDTCTTRARHVREQLLTCVHISHNSRARRARVVQFSCTSRALLAIFLHFSHTSIGARALLAHVAHF